MTTPKTTISDTGGVYVNGLCVGSVDTMKAINALRAALAEMEALRPAPPEPVLVTQLKGRTIDGETMPVDEWAIYDDSDTDCWYDADGNYHDTLIVDPATATVLCRPLES